MNSELFSLRPYSIHSRLKKWEYRTGGEHFIDERKMQGLFSKKQIRSLATSKFCTIKSHYKGTRLVERTHLILLGFFNLMGSQRSNHSQKEMLCSSNSNLQL